MIATDTIPALSHAEAMRLQAVEFERAVDLLGSIQPDGWSRSVPECPGWDVLTMYRHVLGASEAGASFTENIRQMRRAFAHRRAHGGPLEAALSAVQIEARASLTPEQVLDGLRAVGPRCVRSRTRLPAPLRRFARMPVDGPVVETWRLGYLVDTIFLRDLWMHRIDAARVVGRELVLTSDQDGRIVADVVAEWARRHGMPCTLELTGPAGGSFRTPGAADAGERHTLDAVEFCRILAGRSPGEGLLATIVPF